MSSIDFFESRGYMTFDKEVKDHISEYYKTNLISLGGVSTRNEIKRFEEYREWEKQYLNGRSRVHFRL